MPWAQYETTHPQGVFHVFVSRPSAPARGFSCFCFKKSKSGALPRCVADIAGDGPEDGGDSEADKGADGVACRVVAVVYGGQDDEYRQSGHGGLSQPIVHLVIHLHHRSSSHVFCQ